MLRRRFRTGRPNGDTPARLAPARYSGARTGPEPPARGTAARVALAALPRCVGRTVDQSGVQRDNPREPPFKLAFFNRLSYWCDIRCAWICAMKSITTTTTISSEVPPK